MQINRLVLLVLTILFVVHFCYAAVGDEGTNQFPEESENWDSEDYANYINEKGCDSNCFSNLPKNDLDDILAKSDLNKFNYKDIVNNMDHIKADHPHFDGYFLIL